MGTLHPEVWGRKLITTDTDPEGVNPPLRSEVPESGCLPWWAGFAGLIFGVVAGSFEILNTSIGWHLAAGRWMLENRRVLAHNPFTLTADGATWLNHEWLFQVIAAMIELLGSGPGLIGLRILCSVLLIFMLIRFGRYFGLPAALCVFGARMRFYVRPELATLILVPLGVYVFLTRKRRRTMVSATLLGAISAIGINLHGAILVLPGILGALVIGEWIDDIAKRRSPNPTIIAGITIVTSSVGGALCNPWGWHALIAPFRLAHLVGKPWVPNPEWISPGPTDVPELYIALVVSWALFVVRERNPVRWILLAVMSALALRYVRNVGLFFTVLPLAVAPALAGIGVLRHAGRRASFGAAALVLGLAALMVDAPGFPLGLGFSIDRYPVGASSFLEQTGLLNQPIYNDVRFGGWLIGRYFPPVQPFIDDRNEIHEDLLKEMWEIDQASSPKRWQALMDRYHIQTALLRYHEPLRVVTPAGEDLGFRGYSALWFPQSRWALVYWDDTAMVLVDRTRTTPDLVAAIELRWVRPDDVTYLMTIAQGDPLTRASMVGELRSKLKGDPECRRAQDLLRRLSIIPLR